MAATYSPIATTTLGSSTNTVTFSSISSAYTDIVAILNTRSDYASASDGIAIRVNGDTGTNYSQTDLYGDGASAASGRTSNDSYYRFYLYTSAGSTSASGTFGTSVINFMNYSNTTTYKTAVSRQGVAGAGTSAFVGTWRNAAAINSISFIGFNGNFSTGSTFTLYGIASA